MRDTRSPGCRSIGLLVAIGQLAGCHAVFPYEARRSDAGLSDGDTRDGPRDGRAADVPDGELRDLTALLDGVTDLPAAGDGCFAAPSLTLGGPCAKQCLVATGDQECDGLPDERDPWPAACNQGLLVDELTDPAAWQRVGGTGGVSWSCGAVTLDDATTLRLGNAAFASSPAYLTEVELSVDQIVDAAQWSIGVRSAVDGQQLRSCAVFFDERFTSTGTPVPSVDAVGPQGSTLGGLVDQTRTVDTFAAGAALLLQLWSEPPGTHRCRVMTLRDGALHSVASDAFALIPSPALSGTPCDDGFCITATDICAPCPATPGMCCTLNVPLVTPGTIELFATGARATFTSVRVLANPSN